MTDVHDPTLGDLVLANPAAARVLEAVGLDYCCHGDQTLADACRTAGIDVGAVAERLAGIEVEGDTTWASLSPPDLAAHIVETHHRYLHDELPLLDALAVKVRTVHGDRHPELVDVARLVTAIREDLEPHLMKEERVLFPAIAALAEGRRDLPFGPVANPIRKMGIEHDRAGELLVELRAVAGAYDVPADGCASYRSLYERLEALELDTHLHIHKENHVLFPAALRLWGPDQDG
jgi:regulator of cell morphogenesis and NO signaling